VDHFARFDIPYSMLTPNLATIPRLAVETCPQNIRKTPPGGGIRLPILTLTSLCRLGDFVCVFMQNFGRIGQLVDEL